MVSAAMAGVAICLERGADLHMSQVMSLPLTVSCFSKIQIGFTFLVQAYSASPGQRTVKRVCMYILCCIAICFILVLANKINNNNSTRKLLLFKLPKYWLQFKNRLILSFVVIFDTLPLRIIIRRVQTADLVTVCQLPKSRRHLKRCTINDFIIIIIILILIIDNVYGAIIMTKDIARVHSVHLMNVDWAPGGRQPSDQTSRLRLWVLRKLAATIHIHHRHCYYYSTRRLILILPCHEGRKAEST